MTTYASHLSMEVTATLETRRCWKCGLFWAIEKTSRTPGSTLCPSCADEDLRAKVLEIDIMRRKVSAYKGTLTKANNRRKK